MKEKIEKVEEIMDLLAHMMDSASSMVRTPSFTDTAWAKVLAGIIKSLPLEPGKRAIALREALESQKPLAAWIQKKILSVEGKRDLKGLLLIELKEK